MANDQTPVDHVMVTAGRPYYASPADMDFDAARRAIGATPMMMLGIARHADKVRRGGTLLFMSGTGGRHPGIGLGIISTPTAALPALTANLALEIAPVRVNLIAAGFVDTSLSASLLGEHHDQRRNELGATLPIGRVVGPATSLRSLCNVPTRTRHRRQIRAERRRRVS